MVDLSRRAPYERLVMLADYHLKCGKCGNRRGNDFIAWPGIGGMPDLPEEAERLRSPSKPPLDSPD